MRTLASLRMLSLKQTILDMGLREAVDFLESQHEHLSVEGLRELLAPKLKVFDPFNLDQRMDLTTVDQLFKHVRALLAGTSYKYGYVTDEEGHVDCILSSYYDLKIGQGMIPMEVPVDGLLPIPETWCAAISVGSDDKTPAFFFFPKGGQLNVEAIRRYVAWRLCGMIVESDEKCRDPEWFEIWIVDGDQLVPRTSLKVVENGETTEGVSWERVVFKTLSFIDLPFIENEMHARAVGGDWSSMVFSFGGSKPNWSEYLSEHNVYIGFRGFVTALK